MADSVQIASTAPEALLQLTLLRSFEVRLVVSSWVTGAVLFALLSLFIWQGIRYRNMFQKFEIDQAEVGIGTNKLKLSINETDRQIAYKIWVELSTRKIGLPIDLEHDVIAEIYDSWALFRLSMDEVLEWTRSHRGNGDEGHSVQSAARLTGQPHAVAA